MHGFEETTYRLDRMIQKMPIGCAVIQGSGSWRLISGNEEFFHTIGYTMREMQRMSSDVRDTLYRHILYKEDLDKLKEEMKNALDSEDGTGQCEVCIRTKSGEIRWVELRIRIFYYEGEVPYFVITIWDIHDRKCMEEELYLQTERFKLMEEINNEFPFEYDVNEKTLFVSARSNILMSHRKESDCYIPLDVMKRILHRDDCEKFLHMIAAASEEELDGCIEYRVNIAGDEEKSEYCWHKTTYKSIRGVDGRIVRILGRTKDITSERIIQDKMEQRLTRDDLTGLLNRAAVKAEVEGFLMSNPVGRHALFLIDIDNFKYINDTMGHLFGDNVLVKISKKIRNLFRGSDVIGRIGVDEFIILMKHTDFFQAKIKAESICEAVRQKYHDKEGKEEQISCSVGIAMYGLERESYTTLFSKADKAMYKAKEAGKNQYWAAETADPVWQTQEDAGNKVRDGRAEIEALQEMDFISEAFVLMSNGDDADHSLNLLMERIGKQYDLGIVSVVECDKSKRELVQTNCWTRDTGIVAEPSFAAKYEDWRGFKDGFDERGLAYINDCYEGENVTESDREAFREKNIHALVNCSFSYCELGEGYVSFCDLEKSRIWTDYEKETFLELTRMLSVFVALRVQKEEDLRAIRHLKKSDMLTGLYVEDVFQSIVKEKLADWEKGEKYAIVYTDINDFSYINDNLGHAVGNELLKSLAEQFQNNKNMITCRLYSDLFVSLIWGEDRDMILKSIVDDSVDFTRKQKDLYSSCNIGLTIGIYFLKNKKENIENAIENANLARKSIKGSSGMFCKVYEDRMRKERETEKRILAEFHDNLNAGMFQVYIQPKFHLSRFEFYGGEALVRLLTKTGEVVSPINFIPVLEKSGYVVELDFYMFEQVLIYMKRWKDSGKQLPVISVNFSRGHFEQDGIYNRIVELVEKYQIEPKYIEIEITESLFVLGYDLVKTEIHQLREDGFRVAIDDFGTGYSSLGMLLDIPADIVKIDKSFLNRKNRKNEREFIRNMGQLIRSVKEEAIFEGIETEEQRAFLIDCGFDYGQGFLFDRPLPIDVFQEKYMK